MVGIDLLSQLTPTSLLGTISKSMKYSEHNQMFPYIDMNKYTLLKIKMQILYASVTNALHLYIIYTYCLTR